MNLARTWIVVAVFLVFVGGIWLLWVRPKAVDMSQYAPADSLVYIEINEPAKVLTTLAKTDAWRLLNQHVGAPAFSFESPWQTLIRMTGIGPIDSVILSRSQVSIVVTKLGTKESGQVLRVKPEAALLVETHTSERRIRAPIERHLETFVRATYSAPILEHRVVDGVSVVEFRDSSGSSQLIAAFIDSLVVVGNSREIVEACVGVARRRTPSLRSNPQLQNAKSARNSTTELAFGYIPAEASSKLLSSGVPVFLGRAPEDTQFQRLIQNSASKLIGSVTWTVRSFRQGIEDRYMVEIKPEVAAELIPHFGEPRAVPAVGLSDEVYSITNYSLENPLATWQSLRTSVSRRVDTVAAVVFNTTLKTSLAAYGLDDPEAFLAAVKSPLRTVRLDPAGERQLLVATVGDLDKLTDLFSSTMRRARKNRDESSTTIMENSDSTLSVALNESLIMIGHPVDVQQYYRMVRERDGVSARVVYFVEPESRAHVVTHTNDGERIRAVAAAIATANRKEISSALSEKIDALPYATTETTLTGQGLTRITRSPLGQFSALVPLLVSNKARP